MDRRKLYGRICLALFLVAIVNFISFNVVSAVIGGAALNGKVEAGHYFLSDHGKLTEVSRTVFAYSWVHGGSVFATHIVAVVACVTAWRFGLPGFTRRK